MCGVFRLFCEIAVLNPITMRIVIIRYNAGNIFSVQYALKRLGVNAELTDDPCRIRSADKVIFPGVGEASTTMQYHKNTGLDSVITSLEQPVLGICVGLQLLCSTSQEGNTFCLNVFEEKVTRFISGPTKEKIPHMGWNVLREMKTPLFKGLPENPFVYFVHSYRADTGPDTIARTDYAGSFSAALQKRNFYAVQFHPEKSGETGHLVLKNFLQL